MSGELTAEQLDRYSRHVILEEIGPTGQGLLLDAGVLVVGAGGLGAPVLQYLAAAGIGRLGIVDDDVVERSNLQRQVIHGVDDVGRPKVESAKEFVHGLNQDVEVETHPIRLDADSIDSIVPQYDVVVDASDNFPTRYLLNDYCHLNDLPLVYGAIYRFEGQVSTFTPDGSCYRCLFPHAPEPGTVPNCATAGVLGILPGTIGCLQATEVVKLLTETGRPLSDRLLVYDAKSMTIDAVDRQTNPACPLCGEDALITDVTDVTYSGACAIDRTDTAGSAG